MTTKTISVAVTLSDGTVLRQSKTVTVTAAAPSSGLLLGAAFGEVVGPSRASVHRAFDWNDSAGLQSAVSHGVTKLSLSSRDDTTNAATVVSRIKTTFQRYPQFDEIDYAHENEVDRDDHRGSTDADIAAWARESKAISDAIYAADFGAGKTVGFAPDFTNWGIKQGVSAKMMQALKDVGCRVGTVGSSCYPPGRNQTPAVTSPFADFLWGVIDLAAQFGIPAASAYESGTPLSPNYDRAAYVATWAPEFDRYAKTKGVRAKWFCYWPGQKASDAPDNRFTADGSNSTTVGKTEKAFFASIQGA